MVDKAIQRINHFLTEKWWKNMLCYPWVGLSNLGTSLGLGINNKSFHIFVRGFMWLLVPKPEIKTSEHYYCSILLMYENSLFLFGCQIIKPSYVVYNARVSWKSSCWWSTTDYLACKQAHLFGFCLRVLPSTSPLEKSYWNPCNEMPGELDVLNELFFLLLFFIGFQLGVWYCEWADWWGHCRCLFRHSSFC